MLIQYHNTISIITCIVIMDPDKISIPRRGIITQRYRPYVTETERGANSNPLNTGDCSDNFNAVICSSSSSEETFSQKFSKF